MSGFETNRNRAQALLEETRPAQALPILQRLIRQRPDDVQANNLLCTAYNQLGQPAAGVMYIERAMRLSPDDPGLIVTQARSLVLRGFTEEALRALRSGLDSHPESVGLTTSLGLLLTELGRPREAVDYFRNCPILGIPAVQAAFATPLKRLGRTEEAVAAWERAFGTDPVELRAASGLCPLLNYSADATAERVLRAHRNFAALLAAISAGRRPQLRTRDRDRAPMRIGLVSPDLREHSVAYFLEPILEHCPPEMARFVLYYTNDHQDEVTRRLASYAERLRMVLGLASDELAEVVAKDGIDVLIDCSGLTDGHRLQTFHLRPAPLTVTAIGYPSTTGMGTIDYRLVDSLTDPPGAEAHAAERLWRLDPCFLCYRPPAHPPPPQAGEGPGVSLVSFNALKKINRRVLSAWAQVLARLPDATLTLKNSDLGDRQTQEDFLARFNGAGGDPGRMRLQGWAASTRDHLLCYRGANLALDTFPYNGTTTTCESLLMGVPVVSLAGGRHSARVGLSLLTAAGLPELVAKDESTYVELAVSLANDRPALARLQAGLRDRFLSSVLCDQKAYAARFVHGLRRLLDLSTATPPEARP